MVNFKSNKFSTLYFDKEELKKKLLDYEQISFISDRSDYSEILRNKALEYYEKQLISPIKKNKLNNEIDEEIVDVVISNNYLNYIKEKNTKYFSNDEFNSDFNNKNITNKSTESYKKYNFSNIENNDASFLKRFIIGAVALGGILYGGLSYKSYLNNQKNIGKTKDNLTIIEVGNENKNNKINYNREKSFKSLETLSNKYIIGFCDKDGKVVNLKINNSYKSKSKNNERQKHYIIENHINKHNLTNEKTIHKKINNSYNQNNLENEIKLLEIKYKPMDNGLYYCEDVFNCYESKYGTESKGATKNLENILIRNNEMLIDIPKGNNDFKIHYPCYNNLRN